jgi:hypothetical protein
MGVFFILNFKPINMIKNILVLTAIAATTILFSCKCSQPVAKTITPVFNSTGPAMVIYKTKKDYSLYIPVTLSDDGSRIVSYPAPTDVMINDKLTTPSALINGYWLDNRGINMHTAFINITYEAFSKLNEAPSLDKMYAMIIDKNPFTEFYACGLKAAFGDDYVANLNKYIAAGGLQKCNCLKK